MVRAGDFTDSDRPDDSHVTFSTDGGANWFQGTEPSEINNGGTVATSADGLPSDAKFKATPEGDIWLAGDSDLFRSTDSGATFTSSPTSRRP